jgi:hypothetical protein
LHTDTFFPADLFNRSSRRKIRQNAQRPDHKVR